jgi:hypothetical protein
MGDRSIHCQGERLDDQGFARFEMSVEATVRETPASFIKSATLMPSAPV